MLDLNTGKIKKRLLDNVNIDENGCWVINVGLDHGYSRISISRSKYEYAHRLSYIVFSGPIEDGKQINHHCDVRNCINPEHIYLGTASDNMRDTHQRSIKNYSHLQRGSAHHKAKLTEEMVKEIRTSGMSSKEAASKYGLSKSTAKKVRLGTTWQHVTPKTSTNIATRKGR